TGAGRAFCAGYDQGQPKSGSRHSDPTGKSLADYIEFWQRTDAGRVAYWTHMWRLGKPVIAAVHGWAMGGGFWYQLAVDITIAAAQQGDHHDGHAGCRHLFRPVARKHAWRACSLLAQRVSREAARGPAPARAQGLSRHARRTVPTRAHGAALGKGPAEEGAV